MGKDDERSNKKGKQNKTNSNNKGLPGITDKINLTDFHAG